MAQHVDKRYWIDGEMGQVSDRAVRRLIYCLSNRKYKSFQDTDIKTNNVLRKKPLFIYSIVPGLLSQTRFHPLKKVLMTRITCRRHVIHIAKVGMKLDRGIAIETAK